MTKTGRSSKWTKEDKEIVREQYQEYGSNISSLVSKYSKRSIEMCAYRQGIKTREFWSKDEDRLLLENYPKLGIDTCKLLPGRTGAAIEQHAFKLKVRQDILPTWIPDSSVHDTDLAYLAGFIDGEGTIALRRMIKGRYVKAVVSYCNSNKNVMEYCAKITQSDIVFSHRPNRNHSDIYIVNIFRREKVLGLLKSILPYMVAKRVHAESVIEYLEMQQYRIKKGQLTNREIELEKLVQSLNKKGGKRVWVAH